MERVETPLLDDDDSGSWHDGPQLHNVPTKPSPDDYLPSNVCNKRQLSKLPEECLSNKSDRPLRHVNEDGLVTTYALQPMFYSVIFILVVELFERFSYYGIEYTLTQFLTGVYNDDWNAGYESVDASSLVSVTTAVAYTAPFIGAYLADSVLGDYGTTIVGSVTLYFPGLLLIALTTVPYLLGSEFNEFVLWTGLLVLWPAGTGLVKSVINVFGAKQFHPMLQSSLIETYYVNFYMCINVGAVAGGIILPIVAQYDISVAYFIPVVMLGLAVALFALGTPRYVRIPPSGNLLKKQANKKSSDNLGLWVVFAISMLTVPFAITYNQMATTFIVQGTVMKKAFGFIDAASMNNADAISVLIFGYLIGNKLYPALAERNVKISTTHKFAIGSALGASSIAWALYVEHLIHSTYAASGDKISVLWQAPSYILIGGGEIFAVSAAYEVAFSVAPLDKKALASATNLFCIGGIPSLFCIALYNSCRSWFQNAHGNTKIDRIREYSQAHVAYYFWVLFGISLVGVIVNLLPPIRDFVASVEDKAAELIKTPRTPRRRPKKKPSMETQETSDEESPLIGAKRHQQYLKYGSGPVLYKSGSMRAGPSLSKSTQKAAKTHDVKYKTLSKLYADKSDSAVAGSTAPKVLLMGIQGRPMKAGELPRRCSSP